MRVEAPYNQLVPTEAQARQRHVHLDELAISIAENGLLQNLVGVLRDDGKIEVRAGERRRRAIGLLLLPIAEQIQQFGKPLGNWIGGGAEKSGCPSGGIPIFLLPKTADEAAHLIENIQREDLWPWEAGRYLVSWSEAGYSQNWIADRLGKSQAYVASSMLLGRQLSPKVTEAIENIGDRSFISKANLFKIARLYDPVMLEPLHVKQVELFENILGKIRKYTPADDGRSERHRVHERAKRLGRCKIPGHARPYVRAIYEFLFSEEPYLKAPSFNWK